MPVRRYRDVGDMPEPRRFDSALEGLAAACAASALSRAFGTTRIAPRGVRRFRSVEEILAVRKDEALLREVTGRVRDWPRSCFVADMRDRTDEGTRKAVQAVKRRWS